MTLKAELLAEKFESRATVTARDVAEGLGLFVPDKYKRLSGGMVWTTSLLGLSTFVYETLTGYVLVPPITDKNEYGKAYLSKKAAQAIRDHIGIPRTEPKPQEPQPDPAPVEVVAAEKPVSHPHPLVAAVIDLVPSSVLVRDWRSWGPAYLGAIAVRVGVDVKKLTPRYMDAARTEALKHVGPSASS